MNFIDFLVLFMPGHDIFLIIDIELQPSTLPLHQWNDQRENMECEDASEKPSEERLLYPQQHDLEMKHNHVSHHCLHVLLRKNKISKNTSMYLLTLPTFQESLIIMLLI